MRRRPPACRGCGKGEEEARAASGGPSPAKRAKGREEVARAGSGGPSPSVSGDPPATRQLLVEARDQGLWFPQLRSLCLGAAADAVERNDVGYALTIMGAAVAYLDKNVSSPKPAEEEVDDRRFLLELSWKLREVHWLTTEPQTSQYPLLRRVLHHLAGRPAPWLDPEIRAGLLAHDLDRCQDPGFLADVLCELEPLCLLDLRHAPRALVDACKRAGVGTPLRALRCAGLAAGAPHRGRTHLHQVLLYFEEQLDVALELPYELEPLADPPVRSQLQTHVEQRAGSWYAGGPSLRDVSALYWLLSSKHRAGLARPALNWLLSPEHRPVTAQPVPRAVAGPLEPRLAFAWSYAAARTHLRFVDSAIDCSAPLLCGTQPVGLPLRWPRMLGWDVPIDYDAENAWLLAWWLRSNPPEVFDWQRNVGFVGRERVFFGMGLVERWNENLGGVSGEKCEEVLRGLSAFLYDGRRVFSSLCPRLIEWRLPLRFNRLDLRADEYQRYTTFVVSVGSAPGESTAVVRRRHCIVLFLARGAGTKVRDSWFYFDPASTSTQEYRYALGIALSLCLRLPGQRTPLSPDGEDEGGTTPEADQSGEKSCFLLSLARALRVSCSNDSKDLSAARPIGHPWLLLVSFIWRSYFMKEEEKVVHAPGSAVRSSGRQRAVRLADLFEPLARRGPEALQPLGQRARDTGGRADLYGLATDASELVELGLGE